MTDGLVEVRLVGVPLEIWQRSQEHTDGLLREFALIVQDSEARAATPGRLLALVQELRAGYGEFSAAQRLQMEAALERGEADIDLTYRVPPAVAGVAQALVELLDEADQYCRQGDHLLTLATPPDGVRFRRWFVGEFVNQVGGAPPVPWREYAGS
ncbi:MAG TPA: hypothetical protein VGV86_13360 [Acidimicrobiales bacterium]|nr:hypothetical protein [Acidimicrobiales bacterium]